MNSGAKREIDQVMSLGKIHTAGRKHLQLVLNLRSYENSYTAAKTEQLPNSTYWVWGYILIQIQ